MLSDDVAEGQGAKAGEARSNGTAAHVWAARLRSALAKAGWHVTFGHACSDEQRAVSLRDS